MPSPWCSGVTESVASPFRGLEFLEYVATSAGMALACSAYLVIADLQTQVGSWAPLAVIGGFLVCVVLALSIGELAGQFPGAPGAYTYFRTSFGPRVGLACSFVVLCVVILFAGAECRALLITARPLLGGIPEVLTVSFVLAATTAANLVGKALPRAVQLIFTALVIATIVGLSGYVVASSPVTTPQTELPFFDAMAGVGSAIFLYMGFEWVTPLGRSMDAYRMRVPWSMLVALVLLCGTYTVLAFAAGSQSPGSSLPHLAVARRVWGRPGELLMGVISIFSLVTTFNAGLMGASRLVYVLAREGHLPQRLTTISGTTGVPIAATLAIGMLAWICGMLEVTFRVYETLLLVCAGLYCAVYGAFMHACLRLRKIRPNHARPFRTRIPEWFQRLLAWSLPLLGLGALLSQPERRWGASVLFATVIVICWCGVSLNGRRRLLGAKAAQ